MKYSYKMKKDIIEWDVVNWWKFIERIIYNNIEIKNKKVLELGARNGGLSLFYALNKANVICSAIQAPSSSAHRLHEQYGVKQNVKYKIIDATDIPKEYDGKFDIVTFKSVLGGVGAFGNLSNQKKMLCGIWRCLRPGGFVIFADNMQASSIHRFFRRHFREHGNRWHYENDHEISNLFKDFELYDRYYCGVLGCFGLNDKLKNFLGRLDTIFFERVFSDKCKYIGIFIWRKPIEDSML